MRTSIAIGSILAACLLHTAPALAQSQRTWVSADGDDANPCSLTAPCRSLAGAISRTAAGGEITVMKASAVGALTITKSINILARGVTASLSGTVTVKAGANDTVKIDGLNFTGFGNGATAIDVQSAGTVFILNSTIDGYGGTPGVGINVNAVAPVQVLVSNTAILGNATAVQAGANATVRLSGTKISGNGVGLANNGGQIVSFGNNALGGNGTDGAVNRTTPLQ